MKSVNYVVKLRTLIKSIAINLVLLSFFIGSSAFSSNNEGGTKPSVKDSLLSDKDGFKSLFTNSKFDPTKPYESQLHPRAVGFVQDYIRSRGSRLEKMKIWGKPYFDMYDGILSQHGLPVELKYLSVIESDLIPNVVSWAGAVGPWQIMAPEARRMGLKVNGSVDERTNFYKSTHAAAKILKELYGQFKDWTLVIAAYNCGAGRVRQAIRKSGSKDFWELQPFLPLETRNHVKRFIGTHYIFEGGGGLTTMTASQILDQHIIEDANKESNSVDEGISVTEISGKYKGKVIAETLNMDVKYFETLNPNFDKSVARGNTVKLKLPADKVNSFNDKRHYILNESIKAFLAY